MTDYQLSSNLDDSQVLEAIKRIDRNIDQMANRGDKAFRSIGDGAEQSGFKIGAVSGITQEITRRLIEMGRAGVEAFKELVQEAVQTAQANETIRASLVGIFDGSTEQAEAAFGKIRELSRKLGVDLTEIAPAFLPKVEDFDQFERLAKTIAGLSNLDPAQGAQGARIALTEALTGDVTSLRKRFELDVGPIQEAQKEFGELEGLISGLETVLQSRGQNFEQFADTAATNMGRVREFGVDLQDELGTPILDVWNDGLRTLNTLLQENETDIRIIVGAVGDLLAAGLELINSGVFEFADGLDVDKVLSAIADIRTFFDELSALGGVIGGVVERSKAGYEAIGLFGDGTAETTSDLGFLSEALETALRLIGLFTTAISFTAVGTQTLASNIDDVISGQKTWQEVLAETTDAAKAAGKAEIDSIQDVINGIHERDAAFRDSFDERRREIEQGNEDDLAAAEAALQRKQADIAASEAAEERAAAQEKLNEAQDKFNTDKQRAEMEAALKRERELMKLEQDAAQRRVDLARKAQQRLADIFRKNREDIADAATDLTRDEQDILRKNARSQEEIEEDTAKEKLQIEEDYQEQLRQIRARFEFDAEEAIRANDAIAFLRLKRRKDFEISEAKQGRDTSIKEAQEGGRARREELKAQLEQELEDARLANKRKLEDLKLSLERDLEANRIKQQRELNEQAINEQRKRSALRLAQQQRLQDFNRHWDQRLADLRKKLQAEISLVQEAEGKKSQAMAAAESRRGSKRGSKRDRNVDEEFDGHPSDAGQPFPTPTRRKRGGGTLKLPRGFTGKGRPISAPQLGRPSTVTNNSKTTVVDMKGIAGFASPKLLRMMKDVANQVVLESLE